MARARKFRPGELIPDVATVAAEIEAGRYVYFHKRPMHPSFLGSMQFRQVAWYVRTGLLRFAERNEAAS